MLSTTNVDKYLGQGVSVNRFLLTFVPNMHILTKF